MVLLHIEQLEQTAFSMVVQAFLDYQATAVAIFKEETDLPQDIAEDITREAIEAMGMSGSGDRLYGKVDFKKAIYVFLPAAHPAALMLDSKPKNQMGIEQRQFKCRKLRCGFAWFVKGCH